jgi:FecR protein
MAKLLYLRTSSKFMCRSKGEAAMRARAVIVALTGLLLIAASFDPARAQSPAAENAISTPIGKIITATGSVNIEHGTAVVLQANIPPNGGETKIGDSVYKGDVVSTGADSKLGIIFVDGTTFNISSNARMVLNEFVYDPKGSNNSTLISLTKGTFTFIAGKVLRRWEFAAPRHMSRSGMTVRSHFPPLWRTRRPSKSS